MEAQELQRLDDINLNEVIRDYVLLIRLIDKQWYIKEFDTYDGAKQFYIDLVKQYIEVYWLWRLK